MRIREPATGMARSIDIALIGCLFLFAAFAPHSIAVTQGAWALGMILWLLRFAFYPPPTTWRTPLDYALLGFFILTGLSALLSYEPMVSIGKLRAASLFTLVYLFAENVRTLPLARLLVITLLASSMVNVALTAEQQLLGRGVKLAGVQPNSPLAQARSLPHTTSHPVPIVSGDTVFAVDGTNVSSPEELATALAPRPGTKETAAVSIYRVEWVATLEVPRGRLLPGETALAQLGVTGWTRGRDWRATGFFGHWVTYAESLQLIASLALGLFLALPAKRTWAGLLLIIALGGLGFSLALTVTRASWLAFLVSAAAMVLMSASRRTIIVVGVCMIPIVLAGLFLLQQRRNVGFLDKKDDSIVWRERVWHDGFQLLISKPRHLIVGVGMDSIKSHWREWGLFDNGRMPMGHMHSNLLQIALERGVAALFVWLMLLGLYARMLWRILRKQGKEPVFSQVGPQSTAIERNKVLEWSGRQQWIDRGLALGALGSLAGFFTSGLVHYNWGDSEVVMIFYFIMGLSLVLARVYLSKDQAR